MCVCGVRVWCVCVCVCVYIDTYIRMYRHKLQALRGRLAARDGLQRGGRGLGRQATTRASWAYGYGTYIIWDAAGAALAHLKEHLSWRAQRERGTCAGLWANAGRGHADAHVQRLPCSEVLQRRPPKGGFEKSRIGREPVDGAAQEYGAPSWK